MGSLDHVNLLEYMRTKTQVDYDSLDETLCTELGPFTDCTTNQIDSYLELAKPEQLATVKQSAALAREWLVEFPGVPHEELAFEIGMVKVGLTIIPLIRGNVHIMANPSEAYNQQYVLANARRLYDIAKRLDPGFDLSRLVIKVPATWEGLQACRALQADNIKTLATTTFSFEQAVLAGEAGCTSVSPFIHELRTQIDEAYKDQDPILGVAVAAQRYYKRHGYQTKVKACAFVSELETLELAGVAAMTLPLHWLQALHTSEQPKAKLQDLSRFSNTRTAFAIEERLDFLDNETEYRSAFGKAEGGKAERKMMQAIEDFCEYQRKGEQLFREAG